MGTVNPVKKIIELAHKHSIVILIDGAQAVQHIKVDVQALVEDYLFKKNQEIKDQIFFGIISYFFKKDRSQYGGMFKR